LVSIMLFTSKGEVSVTVDDRHRWVDIPLPEGVVEDEVDVYSCFLQANGRPPYGCGPSLLVTAKQKHVPAEVIASVNQAPVDTDSVDTTPATPAALVDQAVAPADTTPAAPADTAPVPAAPAVAPADQAVAPADPASAVPAVAPVDQTAPPVDTTPADTTPAAPADQAVSPAPVDTTPLAPTAN
jgi:hypothetical protein